MRDAFDSSTDDRDTDEPEPTEPTVDELASRREAIGQLTRWMFHGAMFAVLLFLGIIFYAEYSLRSDISRSHSQLRDLVIAANSYFVDYMGYPFSHFPSGEIGNSLNLAPSGFRIVPTVPVLSSQYLVPGSLVTSVPATRPTVAVAGNVPARPSGVRPEFFSLTTPIAYLVEYPRDPFSPLRLEGYTFVADRSSFTLVGYGPAHRRGRAHEFAQAEVIRRARTQADASGVTVFRMYAGPWPRGGWTAASPNPRLIEAALWMHPTTGVALAYDPTNGLLSDGDLVMIDP